MLFYHSNVLVCVFFKHSNNVVKSILAVFLKSPPIHVMSSKLFMFFRSSFSYNESFCTLYGVLFSIQIGVKNGEVKV